MQAFIIGCNESGIDATTGLAQAGKDVILFDRGAPWLVGAKDPSRNLSPYKLERLETVRKEHTITLVPDSDIIALEKEPEGIYILSGVGRSWMCDEPPILATGFGSGTALVA